MSKPFLRTKISVLVAGVLAVGLAPAAMADSSDQIQQMQQEISTLQQRLQQLQDQTSQTAAKVDETSAKADQASAQASQTQAQVNQLSGLVPLGDKNGKANTHSVRFGGVDVTFGGFAAEENVYRSASLQSDINSPFSKIPFAPVAGAPITGNGGVFPTNGYYNESEFRMTDRQSRFSILAQGNVDPTTLLSAYYEFDFLGGAATANSNESNSFNLRTRHVYSTVDWLDSGWHLLAGQTWSLATMNSQGITPRNEVTPLTIDAQYVPGFVWARQAQLRLTKDWDKKYWAALSIENAQSPGVGTQLGAIGGGLLNVTGGNTPNYSVNKYPDIVAKVAAETSFGHFELFDLMRNFQYTQGNTATGAQADVWGNSVGAGMILPIIPKTLEFNLSGLYGQGVGRYGTSGLPDATLDASNNLQLLTGYSVLGAAIWHANPKLDIYLDVGEDVADGSTYAKTGGGLTGYGDGVVSPATFNTLSAAFGSAALNAGQINTSLQETVGLWWSFYKGNYGAAKLGLQYSHTTLTDFALTNGVTPSASDNMVMTSLRYYPF